MCLNHPPNYPQPQGPWKTCLPMKLVPGAKKFGDHSFTSPPSFQRFPGDSPHTKLLSSPAGPLVHSSPWSRWKGPDLPTQVLVGGGPSLVLLPLFSSPSAPSFQASSSASPLPRAPCSRTDPAPSLEPYPPPARVQPGAWGQLCVPPCSQAAVHEDRAVSFHV